MPWCVICEKRLARCCSVCHTFSELDIQVCTFCSRSSAHTRYRGHDFCWSCVAGGWGSQSNRRRFDFKYCNCCKACFQERTCEQCGTLNDEKHIAWCTTCEKRVARWCPACRTPNEIVTLICDLCSLPCSSASCWSCVAGGFGRDRTRDDLIRHTAVVANPVFGIVHAPAAGNSVKREAACLVFPLFCANCSLVLRVHLSRVP